MLTIKKDRCALLLVVLLAGIGLTGCTPPGPRALIKGEKLMARGDFVDAIRQFQVATDLLPNSARAWNHLGLALHSANEPARAVRAYGRALSLDRNLAIVHYNLGRLHLERNESEAAVRELTTYTALQPRDADGWLQLGVAQMRQRDAAGASASLQRALGIDPDLPAAWNNMGILLLEQRRPRDAFNHFVTAIKKRPDYPPAQFNLGVVAQFHVDRKPFALQTYKKYLALTPPAPRRDTIAAMAAKLDAELNPPPPSPPPSTNPPPETVASARPNETGASPSNTLASARSSNAGVGTNAVAPVQSVTPGRRASADPDRTGSPKPIDSAAAGTGPGGDAGHGGIRATNRLDSSTSQPPANLAEVLNPVSPEGEAPIAATGAPVTDPGRSAANEEGDAAVGVTIPGPELGSRTETGQTGSSPPATTVAAGPAGESPPIEEEKLNAQTDPTPPADRSADNESGSDSAAGLITASLPETAMTVVRAEQPIVPAAPEVDRESNAAETLVVNRGSGSGSGFVPDPTLGLESESPVRVQDARARLEDDPGAFESGAEKRGVLERLDPRTWFSRRDKPPTPIPGGRGPGSERSAAAPASDPPPVAVSGPARTAAARPMTRNYIYRYAYRRPAPLPSGDRSLAQRYLAEGLRAYRSRRMMDAARAFKQATQSDPSFFEAHYNLGLSAAAAGDLRQALPAYETALTINPASTPARYNFAAALLQADFPRDAAEELDNLLSDQPDEIRAHYLVAGILSQHLGRPREARYHYQRVLELDPRHPAATSIRYWLEANR